MAIINKQTPTPLPESNSGKRIFVKFRPGIKLPYNETAIREERMSNAWNQLASTFNGIQLSPLFSTLGEEGLQKVMREKRNANAFDFLSFFAIDVPPGISAEEVLKAVQAWDIVESSYVEGGPTPPPVTPSDDPLSSNQGYLDAAPGGINAYYAWSAGGNGSGIGFVDMERGWTLNHEDLTAAAITIISGVSKDYHGHGTAVLGEVRGVDNTIGVIGIAPSANTRVVGQWRTNNNHNTADAILSAVAAMTAGDVLLLEAQTTHPSATGYVPVEVELATFNAIQFATTNGIIVVEAGANGSVDLDAFSDPINGQILNRSSGAFRDSGAIMVGAGSSAAPHSRLSFSNFGSRIDCYAWGENIQTTGDGWTGNLTNTYTNSFGGTSGASPIVTGAALVLQSLRVSKGDARLTPAEMRDLLSDPGLNTQSATPATDRIGVMPNLRGIIRHLYPIRRFEYLKLAWAWMILIGGILITPIGPLCLRCGLAAKGYPGDPVIIVLGLITVALGIVGLRNELSKGRI
jgi:hypothetical protein